MHTLLDLVPLSTVLNILLLICYVAVVNRISSFTIIITGVILIEFLHQGIYALLSQPSVLELLETWIFVAWYLGFGLTDFAFVIVAIAVCKQSHTPIQKTSKIILGIFIFLGLLQVARFIEKQYSGTDYFKFLYTQGIPFINYMIVALLGGQLIAEIGNRKKGLDDDIY
ncbi:hypothetical protein [Alteromonas sp. H39]|uniref:hypothetical protein n=1 Tax=Alteromonas sp. H39 TaxID=3389876 RepID=UPI0039E14D97